MRRPPAPSPSRSIAPRLVARIRLDGRHRRYPSDDHIRQRRSELLDLSTISATALQNFDGVIKNFAPGEGIKIAGATSAALDASDPTHSHVIVSGGSGTLATLDLGASYQGRTFTVTSNVVMVSATVTPPPVMTESLKNNTGTAGDKLTSDPTLTDSGDPNAVVHFTIDGIQIAATTTADASGAWTLTPTGLGDGRHTIVASETNAGGTGTASLTFTLDTKAPTVTVSAASANLKAGETDTMTFAFSEAVTGFDNSDVSVSGGTLSAVTPDAGDPNGKTYKATFTPTAGVDATTATIQVAASGTGTSSWTDAAANPGTASNTVSISEDTKAPTASSIAASGPGSPTATAISVRAKWSR